MRVRFDRKDAALRIDRDAGGRPDLRLFGEEADFETRIFDVNVGWTRRGNIRLRSPLTPALSLRGS
jgi:hypothetical protein